MSRPRPLLATLTALLTATALLALALAGLASRPGVATARAVSGSGLPTSLAASPAADPVPRCVSGAALQRVEVGMTLAEAKRLLQDQAVWWGPERGAWSQSYPRACSSTRAMLIQADDGTITTVVNAGERERRTCTTFAEFDRLRDGMPKSEAGRLLRGKQFDLRRSAEWQPVPCQGWSTMQVRFEAGRVATHVRGFYFG